MTDPAPFSPDLAVDALPPTEGDFLLPICLPKPGLLLGEDLAVLVLTTVEGQRVGVPMGHQALSDLWEVVTEALGLLQAGQGTRCGERHLLGPQKGIGHRQQTSAVRWH